MSTDLFCSLYKLQKSTRIGQFVINSNIEKNSSNENEIVFEFKFCKIKIVSFSFE